MTSKNLITYAIGLALALFFQLAFAAEIITGKVIGISDGDTITVLIPENRTVKVRLSQIDAPEKSQDFGQASKQSLSDLVFSKDVSIEVETIDKYGRTVGRVKVGGVDANLQQINRGMAWAYTKYAYEQAYFDAEKAAKKASIGLWSRPDAMPPWEFRHGGQQARNPQMQGTTTTTTTTTSGDCSSKFFCKQMNTCQEAMHYLKDCGLTRLDRDGDGVPCESLCK